MPEVVLVTGASGGIGAAVARRVAEEGAFCVLAARRREACARLAEELRGAGWRAAAVALDVRDARSIREAVADARRAAEAPIDGLVNNAGIAISAPLLPRPGDDRDLYLEHLAVNFHGPRRLAEAVLPEMLERQRGAVVNVASSAGLRGYAYAAAYAASKHALVGYTLSAACELEGRGVAISAVCPHYVDTPMTAAAVERLVEKTGRSTAEARAFFESQNPGGRLVRPEEVAGAVWALLQGGANGRIVELDGAGVHVVREALS